MEYTVLLQPHSKGGFKATIPAFPKCRSIGATEEEALTNLRISLNRLLLKSKIVSLKVDGNTQENDPWLAMAGMWRDDPTWDEYQRLIKKNRKRPRARK
ncbi:type II toxin-antitoxin system HicB family antitoxin [candidate division KSB1 bacterium]|nr:type II toxin-antitoxin system HicB family antitoxin [candidate division KSB1 bacterium]